MYSSRRLPLVAAIAAALCAALPASAAARVETRDASCADFLDPAANASAFMQDRSYGQLRVVQCSADSVGWLGYSRPLPIDCPLSAAPYRGGNGDPYGTEWDFATNDWVTWDGPFFWYGNSVRVHNWTFRRQSVYGMVACYSQPGAAPANRWLGLTPYTPQRARTRLAVAAGEGADPVAGDETSNDITGDASQDVIAAEGGNDTVDAAAGDDQVWAGAGDDRVDGGDGADTLLGGPGDDVIQGGRGNDRLFDDSGRDRLQGGPGDDLFSTVDGNVDRISCGPGRDTVMADRVDRVARDCERVVRGNPRKPRR
jgi:hypothetical protein